MKYIKNVFKPVWIIGLMMSLLLVACSSDDTLFSNGGTSTNPDGDAVPSAAVASISLLTDRAQIPSDSSAAAELTAIVRDANNNFMSGVTVSFGVDSGGVQVTQAETDGAGRAIALVDAAGDPQNRTIVATATIGSVSDNLSLDVTGTQISIAGPSAVVNGDTVAYSIALRDSGGNGIRNETLTVTSQNGNTIAASTLTTDSNGEVIVNFTANQSSDVEDDDVLSASALGITAGATITVSDDSFAFTAPDVNSREIPLNTQTNVTVSWQRGGSPVAGEDISFSTTRGSLSNTTAETDGSGVATITIQSTNAGPAVITATGDGGPSAQLTIEFVATQPNNLDIQADPVSLAPEEKSTITAIVRDSAGNLVKNQRVNFDLTDTTSGSLSNGSAVTDSLGRAQTVYTASSATSGQDGIIVRASLDSNGAIEDSIALTVARKELFITIGTGNTVETPSSTQYAVPYALQVTDADGNAVGGVDVQLSVVPPAPGTAAYATGCRIHQDSEFIDDDDDGVVDATAECDGVPANNSGTVGQWYVFLVDVCENEDVDADGVLDAGEDFNNNGSLEPGNRALVAPGQVTTNAAGQGAFDVIYPREYGGWLSVRLTAKARVEGTEQSHSANFTLPVLASDFESENSPPGQTSPFGVTACNEP